MRKRDRLWFFSKNLIAAGLFALSLFLTCAQADTPASASPDFQAKIVELYSKQKCAEIVRATNPDQVRFFRPNVMAIVAYCDPPWGNAEKIFSMAESLSPTGDLILVLHAKYRMKKDPATAAPLWNKVLLTARNRAFRDMAEEYFAGESGVDRPINLSPTTIFGDVSVGAAQQSNPRPQELSYLPTHGSTEIFTAGNFSWRHWYHWGSVATDYGISYDNFFALSQYNLMEQTLRIPVALHLSADKDMVIIPSSSFSMIGGSLYQATYGLGIAGVVFKSTYKQSVEGDVFQDNYYYSMLGPIGGAHYRFQYSWEFFPKLTYLSGLLRVEHVSAGTASTFNDVMGYFPFSHTDVGAELKGERTFRGFILGFAPSFAYRFDSESSTFPLRSTGEMVDIRREDKDLGLEPSITIPLVTACQLKVWYRYDRIYSNLGKNSYVNWNLTDNTAGLMLKASLSTY